MCCWAACPICFSIGGRCAWKESTCSIVGVLLDSDDLPMGVMRERGMARCCMIDNAEERCWAGERRRRDAGAGADADAVGCVELGGRIGWYRETEGVSEWRGVWFGLRYRDKCIVFVSIIDDGL